jgi:hypothetical protein
MITKDIALVISLEIPHYHLQICRDIAQALPNHVSAEQVEEAISVVQAEQEHPAQPHGSPLFFKSLALLSSLLQEAATNWHTSERP